MSTRLSSTQTTALSCSTSGTPPGRKSSVAFVMVTTSRARCAANPFRRLETVVAVPPFSQHALFILRGGLAVHALTTPNIGPYKETLRCQLPDLIELVVVVERGSHPPLWHCHEATPLPAVSLLSYLSLHLPMLWPRRCLRAERATNQPTTRRCPVGGLFYPVRDHHV